MHTKRSLSLSLFEEPKCRKIERKKADQTIESKYSPCEPNVKPLHNFGLSGFLYVVFGALRLARYNVRSYEAKTLTPYFEGLPTPAAGGIIASIVLMFELLQRFEQGVTAKTIPIIMERIPVIFNFIPGIMILLSFLMITNLRYVGFSKMRTSKKISLNMFIILIVAVLLVIAYPENMIFIMFSIYVLSGIFEYVWRMNHIQREKVKIEKNG